MAKTVFAMITLLEDGSFSPVDPGFGNRPGGGGNRPDNSLPGNIHHPGHPDHGRPIDPGFGQGGRDHIGNQLPWSPNSPDNTLPVPPGITPPPAVPANLKDQLVVLWRLPNTVEWHGKVIDPSLVAGTPLPPEGGSGAPPTAGTPLPPTPTPKA